MGEKRKRDSFGPGRSKCFRKTKSKVGDLPGATLADLSYDIVNNILLKLPIESVFICRCVCKSWRSIMSDPHLAQLHVEHAPTYALVRTSYSRRMSRTVHLVDFGEIKSNEAQNMLSDNYCGRGCLCKDSPRPNCGNHMKPKIKFKLPLRDSNMAHDIMLEAGKKRAIIASMPKDDSYDVVNSCNGLLCLWDHGVYKTLLVCNPVTGEFIRLPQSENEIRMKGRGVYPGFGYLKKTNEYKVIRIYGRDSPHYNNAVVEIHTLGTRSWRDIEYDSPLWCDVKFPTCLNGKLHFLVYNREGVSILYFDLESETPISLPCPSTISSITSWTSQIHIVLGELMGSLCICSLFQDANANHLRFWTMKKCGDGQSWTAAFNIENFHYGPHLDEPRVVFGSSGILIYGHSRFFVYYDAQKRLLKFLEGRGTSLKLEPIFHVPSLLRLKDVVKDDNIEVLNVHSRCAAFKFPGDKQVLYLAKYRTDMRI